MRKPSLIVAMLVLASFAIVAPGLVSAPRPGGTAVAPSLDREREYREVTLPAGTLLRLTLDSSVASDRSRVEDRVRAHLRRPVLINGIQAVPAGSQVLGSVTDVKRSGKVKGRARLAMRFHTLRVAGERYDIRSGRVAREAPGTKKKDAVKIAIPAAGGAVVGGIVGGKKGAAIGTAVGGGGGTAYVLSTRGKEVRLGSGAAITIRLLEPIRVRVPAR